MEGFCVFLCKDKMCYRVNHQPGYIMSRYFSKQEAAGPRVVVLCGVVKFSSTARGEIDHS